LRLDHIPDTLLEGSQVLGGESICFGDDGDEIDPGSKTFHDFNIQRFEPDSLAYKRRLVPYCTVQSIFNPSSIADDPSTILPMTRRADEVQASMHTHINDSVTTWLLFLAHVAFMLVVKEFDDRRPAVIVVHIVAKSRGVDYIEFHLEALFLQFYAKDKFSITIYLPVYLSVLPAFVISISTVRPSCFSWRLEGSL
jgi:hypothetical protein